MAKNVFFLLSLSFIVNLSFGQNTGFGETLPTSRVQIKGNGTTSATSALGVTNNSGTFLLDVKDNGYVGIGTTTPNEGLHLYGKNFLIAGGVGGSSNHLPLTAGANMLFSLKKGALRAGFVNGTQWDYANVGLYSTAFGFNTIASASYATALGFSTNATGLYAVAAGNGSDANGNASTAIGINVSAGAYGETVIGTYNTLATSPTVDSWVATDRLFVIGNGETSSAKSDALVMLKNGNTTLKGALTLTNGTSFYTLPQVDGTVGQVLKTNGNGVVSWSSTSGGASYVAGTGISISADTISNTGDLSATNELELPTQTGNSGKYLTTDGTNVSWGTVSGAGTSLNGAYNEGGAGAGRTITANNGAVLVDGTDGLQVTGALGNGTSLALSGAGTRMFFYPKKAAFRAGGVSSTEWDDTNIGNNSVAFGGNTKASGSNSFATGFGVNSTGTTSFGTGYYINASGDYSFAAGTNLSAAGNAAIAMGLFSAAIGNVSTAIGANVVAFGDHAIAMGKYTIANGKAAIAVGDSTTAYGDASTATGYHTIAGGNSTVAMGKYSTANGYVSTALGDSTTASGTLSTAMGFQTTASGALSTAMGYQTTASGEGTTAMGYQTTASQVAAVAMGYLTTASGAVSTAMGLFSTANGDNSTAIGAEADANGDNSVAMGNYVVANGDNSIATGYLTIADACSETVIGANNTQASSPNATYWIALDRLFTIGNGQSASTKSDALVMLKNGNVGMGTTAPTNPTMGLHLKNNNGFLVEGILGSGNTLDISGAGTRMFFYSKKAAFRAGNINGTQWDDDSIGIYSVAFGRNTKAKALHSTATGLGTSAIGYASTSMGNATTANGHSSTAIGASTLASGGNAVAMGGFTIASGSSSTAMGYGTIASGIISTAMGYQTTASGSRSTTMGYGTTASAYGETAIGLFNTDPASPPATYWVATDRLFTVGNGQDINNKSDAFIIFKNGDATLNGNLSVNGTLCSTSGTVISCSDIRYKQNILPISAVSGSALAKIAAINGYYYDFRVAEFPEKKFSDAKQIGFIAQELEKVYPELVVTDNKGYKSVDYAKITPVLVEAIKELKAKNDKLEADNMLLKAQNGKIEAKIEALENAVYGNAKR